MEPSLYGASPDTEELVFLAGFISKSVAFLAVVLLVLAETRTQVDLTERLLRDANAHKESETVNLYTLLKATRYAYFKDHSSGENILSVGEDRILGYSRSELPKRSALFFRHGAYSEWIEKLKARPSIAQESVVELVHKDQSVRTVEVAAKVRAADQTERLVRGSMDELIVEGFYHDITDRSLSDRARDVLDELRDNFVETREIDRALGITVKALYRIFDCAVALYVASNEKVESFRRAAATDTLPGGVQWPDRILDKELAEAMQGPGVARELALGKNGARIVAQISPPLPHLGPEALRAPRLLVALSQQREGRITSPDSYARILDGLLSRLPAVLLQLLVHRVVTDTEELWAAVADQEDGRAKMETSLLRLLDRAGFRWGGIVDLSSSGEDPVLAPMALPEVAVKEAELRLFDEGQETYEQRIGQRVVTFMKLRPDAVQSERNVLVVVRDAGDRGHFHEYEIQYLSAVARHLSNILDVIAANQTFRKLVGNIAHDIRSPVSAIRNRVHRLKAIVDGRRDLPGVLEKLRDIDNDAVDLSFMASKIAFYKSYDEILQLGTVLMFRDVIQKVLKENRFRFRQSRVPIPESTSRDFHTVPPLYTSRYFLDRVVTNLVINMAKYGVGNSGMRPRVFATRKEPFFEVHFQDWGIGVAEGEREDIFGEGFRGKNTRGDQRLEGSGVGLSIARSITREALGGDLFLAGNQNPTDFVLRLPTTLVEEENS